jgi:hypothetical protein
LPPVKDSAPAINSQLVKKHTAHINHMQS